MYSALAPVDLLLQRAGRLHRHARGTRPTGPNAVLHVLAPSDGGYDFGPTERVYHRHPLLRTVGLLHERHSISLPEDLRPMVEACYSTSSPEGSCVPAALEAEAAVQRQAVQDQARGKARLHLIPEPNAREFRLALLGSQPVGESEEGTTADYFHAQTRLGDTQTRLLVLHAPELIAITRCDSPPPRELLRRLLLQSAGVPAWWLRGATPEEGFQRLEEAPGWARGYVVVVLQDGEWRGRDRRGREFAIRDDPVLGLTRSDTT